jgi:hypothetical protein
MPNTQEILARTKLSETAVRHGETVTLLWQPNLAWAAWVGTIAVLSIGSFEKLQRFIYFQF